MEIVRLLGQQAATVSQLANALERPKGTIGHHVDTLADAGLVRVVRTERVRAIEAKYWGRTARTFVYGGFDGPGVTIPSPVATAAEEYATAGTVGMASLRHAQIPEERAREWTERLASLAAEFASEPLAGTATFGLVLALYETDRPTFPAEVPADVDAGEEAR